MAARYREFVLHVAHALAEEPERVEVEEVPAVNGERTESVQLRLVVAPADVGRLVGRRGRTANAIRSLLSASGSCELEIVAPEGQDNDEGEEPVD